jgi:hypothetical protein
LSELCFEIEVSTEKHLPGDYKLQAVRAYPYELDGREDLILEFERKGEISFRIGRMLGFRIPAYPGVRLQVDGVPGAGLRGPLSKPRPSRCWPPPGGSCSL